MRDALLMHVLAMQVDDFDPVKRNKYLVKRAAFLARYGRIPPSELDERTDAWCEEMVEAVSELVRAEHAVRDPLNPIPED